MGYHRAGFDVVGVDINPQPHYPFEFHQADALTFPLEGFDAIHASPPCQAYTRAAASRKLTSHPDLVDPVRERLTFSRLPWVIENVPGAPLRSPLLLCGAAFGIPIIRHRIFETNVEIPLWPTCGTDNMAGTAGHGAGFFPYAAGTWEPAWRERVIPEIWPWMTLKEAGQAIPPAYTEWIGRHLLEALGVIP